MPSAVSGTRRLGPAHRSVHLRRVDASGRAGSRGISGGSPGYPGQAGARQPRRLMPALPTRCVRPCWTMATSAPWFPAIICVLRPARRSSRRDTIGRPVRTRSSSSTRPVSSSARSPSAIRSAAIPAGTACRVMMAVSHPRWMLSLSAQAPWSRGGRCFSPRPHPYRAGLDHRTAAFRRRHLKSPAFKAVFDIYGTKKGLAVFSGRLVNKQGETCRSLPGSSLGSSPAGFASKVMHGSSSGLVTNLVLGIVGAFVGGILFSAVGGRGSPASTSGA